MISLPRVMLAAPASGSGKTTLVCGLLQAFQEMGLNPAAFKCGPDFIDPMFHEKVIGTPSRNLDPFFTDRQTTRYLFASHGEGRGISILEGVMGYFDGLGGSTWKASSYDLACMTDTPVLLVLNARGMSLSVLPWILGLMEYQKRLGPEKIRGVILNQTTKMTYQTLKPLIEEQAGVKAYGYVPALKDCRIESRHLGLITPGEITDLREKLSRLADVLRETVDLEGILALAKEAPGYGKEERVPPRAAAAALQEAKERLLAPKIAVARDEAFCFYYADNLELLERMGARLLPFSPLRDETLPEGCSGLLLGGGYPELYTGRLSENRTLLETIRKALLSGMPCLAECGGFMYLHEEMEDMEGRPHAMAGVVKGKAFGTGRLSRFGYLTLETEKSGRLLEPGETIRAHEFHYFDSENPGEDYQAKKPTGRRGWRCVHAKRASAWGYPHLYYWSNPSFALRFLREAQSYAEKAVRPQITGRKEE